MEFECHDRTRVDLSKNLGDSLGNNLIPPPSIDQIDSILPPCNDLNNQLATFDSKPELKVENIVTLTNCHGCSSMTDLPSAIVSEILNCLDPKELGIISCVSNLLQRLVLEHHAWKKFYFERWGFPTQTFDPNETSWKELYVAREFRCKTFMGRYSVEILYGHSEPVRTVFFLASAKIIFTSGYDWTVRMWNMEEGSSIACSRPLGCTIRAVTADSKLLVCGGTDGFLHFWRATEDLPYLFDLNQNNTEFRLWEHEGPITCLALDFTRIYSGSWDMTVRVWDRAELKCIQVLMHNDWVWSLVPHDTTLATTSGADLYVWDTSSGDQFVVFENAHKGNAYSLARSRTGNLIFTGGEDGAIHMFEIFNDDGVLQKVATWIPHNGPVYSLAFEFPWLVSASSDGKLSLIDVRKLLKTGKKNPKKKMGVKTCQVEPPQRMLHGFGPNLFAVDIGVDRIVCGGEEGVVRIWNFSRALEVESRVRALRGIRLENRMRRRRLQSEMNSRNGRADQCSVAAKKNPMNGDKSNVWSNKRAVAWKAKA